MKVRLSVGGILRVRADIHITRWSSELEPRRRRTGRSERFAWTASTPCAGRLRPDCRSPDDLATAAESTASEPARTETTRAMREYFIAASRRHTVDLWRQRCQASETSLCGAYEVRKRHLAPTLQLSTSKLHATRRPQYSPGGDVQDEGAQAKPLRPAVRGRQAQPALRPAWPTRARSVEGRAR